MRRRRGLLAVTVATIAVLVAGTALPAGASAARSAGPLSPGASRAGLPADAPSWFTVADLVDDVPTASSLAAVDVGLPADPTEATMDLVQKIFGTDREAAISATGEVLRRAGLPLVSALGPIVAMPDHEVIVNAADPGRVHPDAHRLHQGRRLLDTGPTRPDPQLRGLHSSIRSPAPQVVGILDQWGKGPRTPTESVVAGTAIRALAAQRHQLLIPSMVVDSKTQQAVTNDPAR